MSSTEDAMEARMERFRAGCRAAGLKLTPQRGEIYRALAESKSHPGVDDLLRRLRGKMTGLSPDTVYRTLASLERIGLVQRVAGPVERARFDADVTPHGHFVCTRCDAVLDFSLPERLPEPPTEASALGEILESMWVIRGVCRTCLAAAPTPGVPTAAPLPPGEQP